MGKILIVAALALGACVDTGPSPEIAALQSQCQQGNTQACGILAQNQQEAYRTYVQSQGTCQNNAQDFMVPVQPMTYRPMQTCRYQGGVRYCY